MSKLRWREDKQTAEEHRASMVDYCSSNIHPFFSNPPFPWKIVPPCSTDVELGHDTWFRLIESWVHVSLF